MYQRQLLRFLQTVLFSSGQKNRFVDNSSERVPERYG